MKFQEFGSTLTLLFTNRFDRFGIYVIIFTFSHGHFLNFPKLLTDDRNHIPWRRFTFFHGPRTKIGSARWYNWKLFRRYINALEYPTGIWKFVDLNKKKKSGSKLFYRTLRPEENIFFFYVPITFTQLCTRWNDIGTPMDRGRHDHASRIYPGPYGFRY